MLFAFAFSEFMLLYVNCAMFKIVVNVLQLGEMSGTCTWCPMIHTDTMDGRNDVLVNLLRLANWHRTD